MGGKKSTGLTAEKTNGTLVYLGQITRQFSVGVFEHITRELVSSNRSRDVKVASSHFHTALRCSGIDYVLRINPVLITYYVLIRY